MYREIAPARRDPAHPLITPRSGEDFWWEENGTFNPGVTEYQGKILLLYRAYDRFHVSRFGLATSQDGIQFARLALPIIDTDPNNPYERLGIEDPRITKLGDTYYIFHTSASYHRLGEKSDVTSPHEHVPWRVRFGLQTTRDWQQFKNYGVLLPDIPAKNACLFPEKIDGSFALLYREHMHIEDAEHEVVKLTLTDDWHTFRDTRTITWPTPEPWQQSKFGLGTPPLRVHNGWLLVYHAVDANSIYRLGLMMLHAEDPSQIAWVSNPILEPKLPYEKEGFIPNVVYACGALVRGQELWIYYGAADRIIARAILPLAGIL